MFCYTPGCLFFYSWYLLHLDAYFVYLSKSSNFHRRATMKDQHHSIKEERVYFQVFHFSHKSLKQFIVIFFFKILFLSFLERKWKWIQIFNIWISFHFLSILVASLTVILHNSWDLFESVILLLIWDKLNGCLIFMPN